MFFNIAFRDTIATVRQLVQLYEYLKKNKLLLGRKMKDSLSGLPDEDLLVKELYRLKAYNEAVHQLLFHKQGI